MRDILNLRPRLLWLLVAWLRAGSSTTLFVLALPAK
jgi:hypothetical protein